MSDDALTDEEIQRRVRRLMVLIHAMDCLSTSLSVWLALRDNDTNGVTHSLTNSYKRPVTDAEAVRLQLRHGETTVYRTGALWADLGGVPTRIATANSLIVTSRLSIGVLNDLKNGVSLGIALRKVGVRRHTQPPVFDTVPDGTTGKRLIARITATLFVGGREWAITEEEIDQVVVTHREPGPAVLTHTSLQPTQS